MAEKQILSLKPAPRLEQVGDENSERYRIANIALNDAMILPYNANPGRMEFSERTGRCSGKLGDGPAGQCPLWVISGHTEKSAPRPLYPQ
jgi:hypothetical protein